MQSIPKPIRRSKVRQLLGREYHILKRKKSWYFGKTHWATQKAESPLAYKVFDHQSIIRRPLQSVDMQLQENKVTNLSLAIAHLDGIMIQPKETLSIWKLVGRPSASKGYLEGLVLQNGKISKGIGGGLCQLGNLLFWIFAHSPLNITERYRHGYDVFPDVKRTIPFGAGATLAYNHIDLQVHNMSNHCFQIKLWLDDTHLHGALFSEQKQQENYSIEERNHQIKHQAWGGYTRHNQIYKLKHETDNQTSQTLLVENHAIMMYNPFLTEA